MIAVAKRPSLESVQSYLHVRLRMGGCVLLSSVPQLTGRSPRQHVIGQSARAMTAWDPPHVYYIKHLYAATITQVRDDFIPVDGGGLMHSAFSSTFVGLSPYSPPQGGSWTPQVLSYCVQTGLHSNPLAVSLGLLSEEAVKAFLAAGLPGLDLVLLSTHCWG